MFISRVGQTHKVLSEGTSKVFRPFSRRDFLHRISSDLIWLSCKFSIISFREDKNTETEVPCQVTHMISGRAEI